MGPKLRGGLGLGRTDRKDQLKIQLTENIPILETKQSFQKPHWRETLNIANGVIS